MAKKIRSDVNIHVILIENCQYCPYVLVKLQTFLLKTQATRPLPEIDSDVDSLRKEINPDDFTILDEPSYLQVLICIQN
jgi:hypothetical protein